VNLYRNRVVRNRKALPGSVLHRGAVPTQSGRGDKQGHRVAGRLVPLRGDLAKHTAQLGQEIRTI
jgi:hypothetical protein